MKETSVSTILIPYYLRKFELAALFLIRMSLLVFFRTLWKKREKKLRKKKKKKVLKRNLHQILMAALCMSTHTQYTVPRT